MLLMSKLIDNAIVAWAKLDSRFPIFDPKDKYTVLSSIYFLLTNSTSMVSKLASIGACGFLILILTFLTGYLSNNSSQIDEATVSINLQSFS